ncbi:MAG TPA: endonuclease/exonuclease/phosphatase family protein [Bryobacteraceae bacterium]|nr:endonuclease/exonuclease/phosphatase family protein [Bryobacteraceae bacterium]
MRLLSYNIRLGGGGREQQIAAVIKSCSPDMVILQEAIRPDVVEHVAKECGFPKWAASAGDSLAYLSRMDIAHHAWREVRLARRRYLEMVMPGTSTRIFGVHLAAIHSNVTERRREHELKSLLANIAQHQHGFHVVTGDFNTLAPGEQLDMARLPLRYRALAWLTGRKIRWKTIQLLLDAGYVDGYRLFHKLDAGHTFPTWDPHVRLDYVFVPKQFADRLTSCDVIRDAPALRDASDHFPLVFEITEG